MQWKVDLGCLEALKKPQDYYSFNAFFLWFSKCFMDIYQAYNTCEVLKHCYFPKGG